MSQKLGKKKRRELVRRGIFMPEPGNPEFSFAAVELYRWQHGELPPQDGTSKGLDIPQALNSLADGFKSPEVVDWPRPESVAAVLRFAAARIKQLEE